MKNLIFLSTVLFLFSFGITATAQMGPILPYGNYSKEQILDSVLANTPKGASLRQSIVAILAPLLKDTVEFTEKNITWAFAHSELEEIQLSAGKYQNSGWEVGTQKIKFFPGKDWEGFALVFRWGSFEKIFLKGNCGNILDVSPIVQKSNPPKELSGPLRPAPTNNCKPKASACNCDSECAGTLAVEWSLSASGGWVKDQCGNFLPADKWFLMEYGDFHYRCTNCSLPAFTKGWIKACGRIYYINPNIDPGPRQVLTKDIHY